MQERTSQLDPDELRFVACVQALRTAREELRTGRGRESERAVLRAELLAALEGYAEAITRLGAPLPRGLRTEIDLYRRLRNRA